MISLGGLDPELVAEIQKLTGQGGSASAMTLPPAGPPDDETTVMDTISGILTSPFRLIGAAKRGIEDAVGHPNAIAREQQDAQYDMTLKYLLASDSVPDDIKRMLPLPQTDRSGYVSRQISTNPTATGRDNSTLPVPTPRRPGVLEWLTGEDRRQRARDQATIQAALKLAGYDYDLQKDRADVRQKNLAGDKSLADTLKTDYETQLLYRYGDAKEMANIDQSRAAAQSSRASAASSYATRDATMDRNSRENEFYNLVRLPGGLENNTRRQTLFDQAQLPTAMEKLRQLREIGPLNAQAKQAAIARQGGGNADIPKDYVNLVKARNIAINQARDDYNKQWHLPWNDFDPSEIDAQFMITHKDDGTPDWEALIDKVRPKQPSISTKPTGAERYRVYDMLKKSFPELDDGVINSRADLISEAMPKLDFTSEDAFITSADMAGLNDEEIVALWNSRNQ